MLKVGNLHQLPVRDGVTVRIVAECAPVHADENHYIRGDDRPWRGRYFLGVATEADGSTWFAPYVADGRRLWDDHLCADVLHDLGPLIEINDVFEMVQDGMALWEAMLAERELLKQHFEDYGTCQMRYTAARLVPYLQRDYRASDDQGNSAFDWDFCPAWVRGQDWTNISHHGAFGEVQNALGHL